MYTDIKYLDLIWNKYSLFELKADYLVRYNMRLTQFVCDNYEWVLLPDSSYLPPAL